MSTPSDTPDGARREAVQRLQAKRALAMQAWNLYGRRPITEEEIRREMARGEEPPPS